MNILSEALTRLNYIVVNVYVNGEYSHKEKIQKSLLDGSELYSGKTIVIPELIKGTVIDWDNGHYKRTGKIKETRETVREGKTEYLVLDLDDDLGTSAHWVALCQISSVVK